MIAGIRYPRARVYEILRKAGWELLEDDDFVGETGVTRFWRAPNGKAIAVPDADHCLAQWNLELILADGK